jgi:phosphatidylserine decarboxylase
MSQPHIEFFNRHRNRLQREEVYGEGFLRFAYGNPLGRLALHAFIKRPAFSRWYGAKMNDPASADKIAPFIEQYGLDVSEFADPVESFPHFNAFFSRKLRPGARPIDPKATAVFPADGRHFGFERAAEVRSVFVKGQKFDLARLLGDADLADRFAKGPLVLSRLCPVDYHRFHFPCSGTPGESQLINGPLFSVSPIALRRRLAYLWENKRRITPIETEDLGLVLMIEVGATCVGSIQQTYVPGEPVAKGDEKGYFEFGGSSTITLFEPGSIELASDLLEHSSRRRELYAQMGSLMAH